MKQLYIRIRKAKKDSYWYSNKIGEIFKVSDFGYEGRTFLVWRGKNFSSYMVSFCDCVPATKIEYKLQRAGNDAR